MSSNSASPRMKRGMAGRGGPGRGRIKPSSNAGSQPSQNLEGLYSNDRLVNAVASVLGCNAKVSEKSGKQFEGVFKTMSPEASLVLGKANQVEEQKQNGVVDGGLQNIDIIEQFVMNRKDWVRVEFKDVNVEECYFTGGKKDSFKTDFAIGGNKRMNGQTKKELEKWEPGDGTDSLETAALEGHHSMENGWTPEKMFEKNEKMYGVKSTYSEGMEEYTTKLDKNDTPEYRERERYAAQKAEEIFKESPHERNIDSGRSEEQLYSSVVRSKTFDRTSTNWRQPHRDRPPEREQRTARLPQEGFGSPTSVKKEQARSQQTVEPPTVQVKEKIEKPATETPVKCKPEQKVEEAFSDVVKADVKPAQNQAKPLLTPANTPVTPQTTEGSTETPQDSSNSPDATTAKTRSKDNVKIQKELKEFAANFQLAESKKKPKAKKVSEEEQKTSTEATSKEEKNEEAQTSQEVKTDSEAEKQATSGLNPNAQEFRPRVKRNTPSP
ncbi:Hypothetical predicted protein, partial [Paramuricea clavata]